MGLLPCAFGGSEIQRWLATWQIHVRHFSVAKRSAALLATRQSENRNPKAIQSLQADGDLFKAAVAKVERGRALGGVLRGILWHQGESDSASRGSKTSAVFF